MGGGGEEKGYDVPDTPGFEGVNALHMRERKSVIV